MRTLTLRVKRILLLLGGTTCGVILAECILRFVGLGYPLPYIPDFHTGTRLQPGFQAWFHKEGHAYVRINSAGFRDREHALRKPPNTFRIAVLGDSYAEALQVPLEKTFWSVLERELHTCDVFAGKTVEVLNFGVSGYGTAQELLVLRHYVWDYEPDLVLLAFTTGNDVQNNYPPLEPVKARPFFHLKNDRLELDTSFREHPDYLKAHSGWTRLKVNLINRSRILQVLNELKNHRSAEVRSVPGEIGLSDKIYLEPVQDNWREAWTLTEALLIQMHHELQEKQTLFVVATLTNGIQVHPHADVRNDYCRRLGVPDLFRPERRIQEVGARTGFAVIALAEPMRAYAEQNQCFLHGFENTVPGEGHWNVEGHQVAGRLLAERICQLLVR